MLWRFAGFVAMAMLCACTGGGKGKILDAAQADPWSDDATVDAPGAHRSPTMIRVVTFNTGTTENKAWESEDDRYIPEMAAYSDEWYGDGLAWMPAVEAVKAFFVEADPDIVAFQEVFWAGDCPGIPDQAKKDFFCEQWKPGEPTVAQVVLGPGWQVMCNPGKPDKCVAVNRRFGTFMGCDMDFCLEGLEGHEIDGCGHGARVGRGTIEREDGGRPLTVVGVHGSSGLTADDQACRYRQFQQVFQDFGDGSPAANGVLNLVMGDFNTDPHVFADADPSAAYLAEMAGKGGRFHFISDVGPGAVPTYAGLVNIDHVISDRLEGGCWVPGVTPGRPAVLKDAYFDHEPIVCDVEIP